MGLECLSSLFLFQDFAQVQFLYEACPNFRLQESQGKLCREAGLGQSQGLLPALTSLVPPLFQCRLPVLSGMKESFKKCSRLKECSVSDIPLWPWGWGVRVGGFPWLSQGISRASISFPPLTQGHTGPGDRHLPVPTSYLASVSAPVHRQQTAVMPVC